MKSEPLKPCPFCGGGAYTFFDNRLYSNVMCGVACSTCGALVYVYPSMREEVAVKAWNKRYNEMNCCKICTS